MFPDRLQPDTMEGNVRRVTKQCARVVLPCILAAVTCKQSALMSAGVCLHLYSINVLS